MFEILSTSPFPSYVKYIYVSCGFINFLDSFQDEIEEGCGIADLDKSELVLFNAIINA